MNIIIIEDELKTAKELQKILEEIDATIKISAILPSVAAGTSWLNEQEQPDLIFSDIQLGDGLSFDIFKNVSTSAPVIFCTAYDEYAIKSFETNGIDYILKPLDERIIKRSIEKYRRLQEHLLIKNKDYSANVAPLLQETNLLYKKTILVHYRDNIIPIKTIDIDFAYAANGLVFLYVMNDRSYTVSYTIEQLEKLLNPAQFFRANRKFIVNRSSIQKIEHYFNRRMLIKIQSTPPEKIIVSKLKTSLFLSWMEE